MLRVCGAGTHSSNDPRAPSVGSRSVQAIEATPWVAQCAHGPFPRMPGEDEMGLLQDASAAGSKRAGEEDSAARRVKLKHYDAAAAQLLNPYGPSIDQNRSVEDLWRAVAEGSKAAVFHSELAATQESGGDYRVGVGLSRVAQSLSAAISALQEPMMAKVLQDSRLKAALAEAKLLEKPLAVLNAGKGSEKIAEDVKGFGKFRAVAGQPQQTPQHSEAAVRQAAGDLHTWLSKEKSALRGMLAILSANGTFYAAQINEKVARGWIRHKPASPADVAKAALARQTGASSSGRSGAKENDVEGLV